MYRFLAARGPGIHHVTFNVPDIVAAAERVRRFGYEVVGYNDEFAYWKELFLHPKQALGIVVQLAEEHPMPEGMARRGARAGSRRRVRRPRSRRRGSSGSG
jgi:catechol 2,3-dioxygenase-like lactoylglutathione lyase family enzyme